jgi:hypothetical protein
LVGWSHGDFLDTTENYARRNRHPRLPGPPASQPLSLSGEGSAGSQARRGPRPSRPRVAPDLLARRRFFRPAFSKNHFNVPGPFYGAETDTCCTGLHEAPGNVLLAARVQEFLFRQPSDADELRDVLSAALCECFCGYGADGDDHWTLHLIRDWLGEVLTVKTNETHSHAVFRRESSGFYRDRSWVTRPAIQDRMDEEALERLKRRSGK